MKKKVNPKRTLILLVLSLVLIAIAIVFYISATTNVSVSNVISHIVKTPFIFVKPSQKLVYGFIKSPQSEDAYVKDQLIIFEASGDKNAINFSWSSNLDGYLGEGEELLIYAKDLTIGEHLITLITNDDKGNTDKNTINIYVFKDSIELDPEFSITPDSLTKIVYKNQKDQQIIDIYTSIRNANNNGDIRWKVASSKKWITFTSQQGITASDITIRIDTRKLQPGEYEEKVTFTNLDTKKKKVVHVNICLLESKNDSTNDKCPNNFRIYID